MRVRPILLGIAYLFFFIPLLSDVIEVHALSDKEVIINEEEEIAQPEFQETLTNSKMVELCGSNSIDYSENGRLYDLLKACPKVREGKTKVIFYVDGRYSIGEKEEVLNDIQASLKLNGKRLPHSLKYEVKEFLVYEEVTEELEQDDDLNWYGEDYIAIL